MQRFPVRSSTVVVALLFAAACGSGDDATTGGGDTVPVDTVLVDTVPVDTVPVDTVPLDNASAGDLVADAPELTPAASFPVADGELIDSISLSPDGATMAVSLQSGLGDPVTIRLFDAQTGEPGVETTFDAIGIGRLHWMGDGRLVATSETEGLWRSWDGETLEAFPTLPLDYECRATVVDRVAGYAYSVLDDDSAVCRTDPDTGEMLRSGDGIADIESLWVRPSSAEVLVVHYPDPDPDAAAELLALDGTDLSTGSTMTLAGGDQIRAVGATTWIDYFEPRASKLEPGSIAAPDIRDGLQASTAGTYFISANGDNDHVYVSAIDGSIVGTTGAEWNPSLFADWSIDDSVMIRMTRAYEIERYEF